MSECVAMHPSLAGVECILSDGPHASHVGRSAPSQIVTWDNENVGAQASPDSTQVFRTLAKQIPSWRTIQPEAMFPQ